MARTFVSRLGHIAATIAGREPGGEAAPPRTGIDPSSRRHLLALVIGTLVIMTAGLLVAFLDDGPNLSTATPTVLTTPAPAGAQPTTDPSIAHAV